MKRARQIETGQHGIVLEEKDESVLIYWGYANKQKYMEWLPAEMLEVGEDDGTDVAEYVQLP